ncbi:DUF4276 family protein [Hugenholtzia roseola]|uniref:DUF4276 family protein n=1 Tax=Hugenholtzia roseola TaxID=1002 RepID=UPI00047C510E|nr:DUF4276 family protein [Hugenholtzia roseola]
MTRVEILTEEPSMRDVLEEILPKILPQKWVLGQNYFVRSHQGKQDLQKSIPRKVKTFSHFHERTGIVIVHDQDSHNCTELKHDLIKLCQDANNQENPAPFLIRIACRELESWYLGDFRAIQAAYPRFNAQKFAGQAKFRNPDNLNNAAEELGKILPEFQKGASARAIAPYLDIDPQNNRSESYKQFIKGIIKFFS